MLSPKETLQGLYPEENNGITDEMYTRIHTIDEAVQANALGDELELAFDGKMVMESFLLYFEQSIQT